MSYDGMSGRTSDLTGHGWHPEDPDPLAVCPECDAVIWSASAWSGGPPDYDPGIRCPECGAFIPLDDIEDEE